MYEFFSVSPSVRWQDIADILLNSYILFRLYVLFRGTNVIRVIAGIVLLWVFQQVAVSLGLIVTSWAMQGIIAGAALIIIIVFRNEIRNVLQAKNLKAILWGFPTKITRTPIDSIVEGVYELAKKRVGALIVLPKNDDLEDHVQKGVAWGGTVSKEMLMSIFWPDNPVHDGAAVIQGDRVSQVGVILPLSERDDFPSYYGTRHRAAAGLAENSDAMVIIVSEERGEVVVTKGSELIEIKDNLELARLIHDHFGRRFGTPEKPRTENTELTMAALICIACVSGIWLSFSRGMETLVTMDVPLEYMNRNTAMEIFDTSVNTVQLHLSGSGALVRNIGKDQVKVRLDLRDGTVGTNRFALTEKNVTLPPGIFLRKMDPNTVEVTLDRPMEKELPIQVDWVGKLPESLILAKVTVIPDTTKVVGGSRLLKEISTIYTEKVLLDTIQGSGQKQVPLSLYPANLKVAPGNSDKVLVRYTISERK